MADFQEMNNKLNGINGGVDNSDLRERIELLDTVNEKTEQVESSTRKMNRKSMTGKTFRKATLDDGASSKELMNREERMKNIASMQESIKNNQKEITKSVAKASGSYAKQEESYNPESLAKFADFINKTQKITIDASDIDLAKDSYRQMAEAMDDLALRGHALSMEMGKNRDAGFDVSEIQQQLNAIAEAFGNIANARAKLGDAISDVDHSFTHAEAPLTKYNEALEAYKQAQQEYAQIQADSEAERQADHDSGMQLNASFDTESVNEWAQSLRDSGQSVDEIIDQISQKMEQVSAEMANMDEARSASGYGNDSELTDHLSAQIEKDAEAYRRLQEIIDEVKSSQEGMGKVADDSGEGVFVGNASDLKNMSLDELKEELDAVLARKKELTEGGLPESSRGEYESIQQYIKAVNEAIQAREKLNEAENKSGGKGKKEKPEKAKDTPKKSDTDASKETSQAMSYRDLLAQIRQKKQEVASTKLHAKGSGDVKGVANDIKRLEDELKKLQQTKETIKSGSFGSLVGNAFKKGLNGIKNAVPKVASAVGGIAKGIGTVGKGAFDKFKTAASTTGNVLKNVAGKTKQVVSTIGGAVKGIAGRTKQAMTTMGGAIKTVAGKGFGLLRSGVDRAKQGLQGMIEKFKSLGGNPIKKASKMMNGFRSILTRRLKRMFITSIFNQVRQGMQDLAKYSDAFNKSMSSIKNSAKSLSGNLAVSFGNILSALQPIITGIVNALSTAIKMLNAFFALLRGGTVTVAKESMDDYAKSIGGGGKAAENALSKFDELNVIGQEGGGGGGGAIEYEEQDPASILNDTMKAIADFIKNGQWEDAGRAIGDMINKVMKTMDDKLIELRPKAVEWARNIAELLNGVVDQTDFRLIGKTIGDGINLIADAYNTFLTTFDFENLGKKLAEGVDGLLDAVEWDLVGETIANHISAKWKMLAAFVENLDWEKLGEKIGILFSSLFDHLDFDAWARFVSGGINGIITAAHKAITTANFEEAAIKFANAINKIFTDIEWEENGRKIAEAFNTITATISNFVNTIDWENIGTSLGTAIESMFQNINWGNLTSILSGLINGLATAFYNFVSSVNWRKIADDIFANLNDLITNKINWKTIQGALSTSINALIDIFDSLVTSDTIVNLASKLGETINGVLSGIDFEKLAKDVLLGTGKIISAFFSFVSRLNPTELAKQIGGAINNAFTNTDVKNGWKEAISTASTGINDVIKTFDSLLHGENAINFEEIAGAIGEGVGSLLASVDWDTLAQDVLLGTGKIISSFFSFVTRLNVPQLASQIGSAINNAFTNKDVQQGWDDAVSGITNGINSIIQAFDNLINGENAIDFTGIATTIGEKIRTLVTETDWETLAGVVVGGSVKLKTAFTTLISEVFKTDENGMNIGKRFSEAINSIFRNESGELDTTMFTELGNSIGEAVKNIFTNIASFVGETNFSDIFAGIADLITSAMDSMLASDGIFSQENMKSLGKGLANFISGGFKAIDQIVDHIDLGGLVDGLVTLIHEIDIGKLLNALFDSIKNIGQKLGDQLPVLAKGFSDALVDMLTSLFDNDTISTLFDTLFGENGILNVRNISEAIANLLISIDWAKLGNVVCALFMEALIRAVQNFPLISDILRLLIPGYDNLFDDLVDAVKNAKGVIDEYIDDSRGKATEPVDIPVRFNGNSVENGGEGFTLSDFGLETFKSEIEQQVQELYDMGATQLEISKLIEVAVDAGEVAANAGAGADGAFEEMHRVFDEKLEQFKADYEAKANTRDWVIPLGKSKIFYDEGLLQSQIDQLNESVSQKVSDSIYQALESSVDSGDKAQQFYSGLALLATGGIEALTSAISDAQSVEKIEDAFYYLFKNYDSESLNIDSIVKLFGEAGVQITEEFATTLKTVGKENVTSAFVMLANGISEEAITALAGTNISEELTAFMEQCGSDIEAATTMMLYKSGMGLEEIASALGKKTSEVLNTNLPEAIKSGLENGATYADTILKEITAQFTKDTSWDEIKKAFEQKGISITEGFAKALEGQGKEDILTAMQLLGAGVNEATIEALNIEGLDSKLQEWMSASGASLQETATFLMALMGQDVTALAGTLGGDVGDALGSTIPDALAKALGIGEEQVKDAKDKLTEAASQTTEDVEAINKSASEAGQSTEVMAEKIGDQKEPTGTATDEVISEVTDTLEDSEETVGTAAEKPVSTIEEKFSKLPNEVKPYAEDMLAYITAAITEGDGTVLETVKKLADDIVNKVETTLSQSKGAEITKAFLEGLKDGFSKNESSLLTGGSGQATLSAKNIADATQKKITKEIGNGYGKDFLTGISDGIKAETTDVTKPTADTSAEDIVNAFTETELNNDNGSVIGSDFMEGVSEGILDVGTDSTIPTSSDVASDVVTAMTDYVNYIEGWEMGSNIADGLENSLGSSAGSLYNMATTIAKGIIRRMKDALEISSPSKVFAEIGMYTMKGLEVGLEGQEGNILNSVDNIATAIVDEMSDQTELSYSFDGVNDGLRSIIDSLSDVASQFVGVAQAIRGMGELEIPVVATGRVIPYSTKISDTADEFSELVNGMTDKLNVANADQTALLIEQNNLLRSLLEKQWTVTPSAAWGRHATQSMQMYTKLTGG